MSYIYLLASAGCSLLLVHLIKTGESRQQRMLHTFTVNYLVAALFAFAIGGWPNIDFDTGQLIDTGLIFAAVTGTVFIMNFLFYSKSIHLNGMGISVAAMRLSLLVPVMVSIWLYQESLTVFKLIGLFFVFLSIGLLIPKKRTIRFKKVNAAWLLIVIFLLTGLADTSLKIYEEDFSQQFNELSFMGLVFFCAFLIGLVLSLIRDGPIINRSELITGSLIGIPNLYSSIFLIYALKEMDGAVAYPLVNILNVLGGTFLGLLIWNDTVTKLQWLGIALSIAAFIFLV